MAERDSAHQVVAMNARRLPREPLDRTHAVGRRSFLAGAAGLLATTPGRSADLAFHAVPNGEFTFDTGRLKGVLRSEGRSYGAMPVTYIPTESVITSSMGLFGIYRVFSAGKRYTKGMWYEASEARQLPTGAVSVIWPSTEERPYTLGAAYRWAAPETLDITITATARETMSRFEVFLACYFDKGFNRSRVLARGGHFLDADEASGHWQMFPRDGKAVGTIRDGRWTIAPNPVDWAIRPEFEYPLAYREDIQNRLCAVVMGSPQSCFAISTPYDSDPHHALYLSLFGNDLRRGRSSRADVRLVVLRDTSEEAIRAEYSRFQRAPRDGG